MNPTTQDDKNMLKHMRTFEFSNITPQLKTNHLFASPYKIKHSSFSNSKIFLKKNPIETNSNRIIKKEEEE